MFSDRPSNSLDLGRLRGLSERDFLHEWRACIGEVPAVMLDREAMLAILAETSTAGPSRHDPASDGPPRG